MELSKVSSKGQITIPIKIRKKLKFLLNLSVSPEIISEKLSDKLYEYLTFRHFFVHAYGFSLEESPLEDLANNIPEIRAQFLLEIDKYLGSESTNG